MAVVAGGDLDLLHLRDLHRHRGRRAAKRSPRSRRRRRHAGWDSAEYCGGSYASRRARRSALLHLFRLADFPARLFQLPHALDDADCLALCGDPDLRVSCCSVYDRAAGQRPAQRFRARRAARAAACRFDRRHRARSGRSQMSGTLMVLLMTFLFLFFGYLGVPVAFSLLAGTLIGAMFTDVSQTAIIQKMFDGMDNEALLAIPFFLLVGDLMSSANVVQRGATLSRPLVGPIHVGLSHV